MLRHSPSNQPTQCSDLFQQLGLLLQGLLIQDVQGPNFEFSTETREELYYTKEKLLDNGDN